MQQDKMDIFLPPIKTRIMSPSNFLKCSSISICVSFCFATPNINIREIACCKATRAFLYVSFRKSISMCLEFLSTLFYSFQLIHFFLRVGENMLHHKKQGTNNPMLRWKFCMGLIHKYQELVHLLEYQTTFVMEIVYGTQIKTRQ